jgi:hypothetical protein
MFSRVYLLIRVMRDFSPVYRKRLEVLGDTFLKQTGASEFNWHLAIKFLFDSHMWPFVMIGVCVTWFMMAYIIWLCERPARLPPMLPFTLQRSVWLVCITMTTVGYGDESPISARGRIAGSLTAVLGLCNTALIVYAVMNSLTLSTQDNRVKNLVVHYDIGPVLAEKSALFISEWWKHHKEKQYFIKNDSLKSEAYENFQRDFALVNNSYKTELRNLRREQSSSMELDDVVIARLDEKLGDWSGYFALCLCRLLGVKRKGNKPVIIPPLPQLMEQIARITEKNRQLYDKTSKLQLLVTGKDIELAVEKRKKKKSAVTFFDGKFVDSLFGLD